MSSGPTQKPTLTRAQRKVLADLLLFRDSRNVTEMSYSQLAETTGLSRSTVWDAVSQLNELELVNSVAVGRVRSATHSLSRRALGQPQPVRLAAAAKAGRS